MDKLSWFLAGILVGGLVGIAVMGYITGDAVDTMTPNSSNERRQELPERKP